MSGGTSPARTPRLEVRWGGGWAEFRETLQTWYEGIPSLPPDLRPAFRDAAVGKHWPGRAVGLSAVGHILLLVLPVPAFLTLSSRRAASEFPRIEFDLQWAGTSRVLPPISPPRAPKRKPSPGGKENQPLPPLGAEQPNRQTIVSTPENPNHPTHTVIRQNALEARVKPKELKLPNMVIPPAPAPAPEATNELDLRRMRVPNAPLDMSGPPQTPRRPKRARSAVTMAEMQLKNLYPRLAVEPGNEGVGRTTAPEIEAPLGAARSGDLDLPGVIALSAAPSAPSPVVSLPEGNLRARFVAGPYTGEGSPGGIPGGTPGASGGEGGGPGGYLGGAEGGLEVPGLLVTPAGPVPAGPVVVGPGGGGPPPPPPKPATSTPRRRVPSTTSQAKAQPNKPTKDRGEELIEGLTPGLRKGGPRGRRIYTIYVNMPNLTSQAGSWVLRFAELNDELNAPGTASDTAIESPVAVRKVDPGYPAEARRDKIEGTVFLYGVIRPDGSVDSVHVVRSVHAAIDRRAVEAFQNWRFDPGRKNGAPVALEVVVEIPFRLSQLF